MLISHNYEEIYRWCDYIIVIKNGKVVEEGTKEEIFRNPKKSYTAHLLSYQNIVKETKGTYFEKYGAIAFKNTDIKINENEEKEYFVGKIISKLEDVESSIYQIEYNENLILEIKTNEKLEMNSEYRFKLNRYINLKE